MLESLVASLLNRFLVKNFDPKQLNIGIWSGDVKLRNLDLKEEALDKFKLPIDVVAGHLGELVLQIPWSNLKNKPVKIVIEDVFLLAAPKIDEEYDAEDEEKRAQELKKHKLENMELIDQTSAQGMSQEEIQKNQSFTDSLVTKIVDNLQVTIKNIHIRYEDNESVPAHPFSLGLTLTELSAVSTDDEWNPIFIQDTTQITKKLATLDSLAMYWNTDSGSLRSDDDQWIHSLKAMIPNDSNDLSEKNQYILRPVSGVGKITMNKQGSTAFMPKTNAQLLFDDLGFVIDSDQYRDALWTADIFRVYMKTKEFKKYRPQVPVKKDPKAWFKFAGTVVLNEIHQKNREWSWDYMKQRRDDRLRYVELYKKKKKQGSTLTPEETTEFNKFEWNLSYEDIRFYRSLAKAELRKEKALTKPSSSQQKQPQQQQSWYNWFWGTSAQNSQQPEGELNLTDEQKQELYDAIEWDEQQATQSAIDIPRERVTLEIGTSLQTGSFRLRSDPHGTKKDIAVLSFSGFRADLYQRVDSFLANVSLQELRVDDKTGSSLYEQVVTVKNSEDALAKTKTCDDHEDRVVSNNSNDDAFFWVSAEHNPLDGSADTKLYVKLKSMTVFYNSLFVESIAKFFKPPKTHLETIGAIMNAAGATVEGLRDQTRIGLEYALEEHKTINLKTDIQAPLIVIPLDVTSWESPCAIIDAGHISVTSDLVGREILDEVKSKQSQKYTDDDWKRLESLMYDKFNLQLHDTQFLIGVDVRETMKQLHNKDINSQFYIIDRINMDFLVEVSILPSAHSLTKFKVSGQLPMFRASMSDAKYKLMMKIIDKCIPNFGSEDEEELTASQTLHTIPTRERAFSLIGDRPLYEDIEDSDTLVDSSASSQTASQGAASSQKIFEFNFRVSKVELSLYRCKNESTLEQDALIDMNLDFFELDYYFMPDEMFADVTLNSLSVEDYIDTNSPLDLRKMVSSRNDSQSFSGHNTGETNDLFNVKYRRMKRLVNDGSDEVYDQSVEVSLSTLRFVLTPKSSLTLLDFIITTFTNPNAERSEGNKDETEEASNEAAVITTTDGSSSSIDVKVNLHGIILVLNDDGIKIATMKLDTAVVGVKLIQETMKIESRIGSLSLHDEVNEGCRRDSLLRQLISIEGDELVDFKYETFDPKNKDAEYNSSIYFRAGSMRINVVEEPFTRIFRFLFRVLQMKGLFDSARQVAMNQANQIQDADKIHFDVLVDTPILVFPRALPEFTDDAQCDALTVNLGEIYLDNSFEKLEEEPEKPISNSVRAGIRATKLTTSFLIERNEPQFLEIIDNLDINFNISYVKPYNGMKRPSTVVKGDMSDIEMRLTELQFKYLLELSNSVPAIFSGDMGLEDEELGEIEEELKQNKNIESLGNSADQLEVGNLSSADQLDFSFEAPNISLTLYQDTEKSLNEEVDSKGLSSFALNHSGIKFRMRNDSSWETDVHVHSFTVYDIRKVKDNKFTEIIPSVSHNESQFMCRISKAPGPNGNIDTLLTIDTPKMILALDYLLALKAFTDYGFVSSDSDEEDENVAGEQIEDEVSTIAEADVNSSERSSILFNVNIVDASIILLANPTSYESEAIVFKTEQLVLSQRNTTTLSVSKIGMYLCQMNKFDESKLRILDDFSFTMSMDSRGTDTKHQLTSIQISVEPLVLRLSLRDMLLAVDVMTKASALSSGATPTSPVSPTFNDTPKYSMFSKKEFNKKSMASKSIKTRASQKSRRQSFSTNRDPKVGETILRGEELTAEFEGLRFVVIGMYHELPMIDMSVKPFTAVARNWSSDLKVDVGTETFTNIYNHEKSAWEPLIETWDIGLHVSKTTANEGMLVNVFSRRMMEVTLTAQTILLLNKSLEYMQEKSDERDFLTKPRESSAPYRVKNETGYPIEIWADSDDSESPETATIEDGAEIPWRFYDWNVMRENLSTDMQKVTLGVNLNDSPYDAVRNVSVTSVGEHPHILHPKTHRVLHRLVCEVKLEDDLKKIVLRSALKLYNNTKFDIEARIFPVDGGEPLVWKISPGASRAVPIQYAYDHPIEVRPDPSLGFSWAKEKIYWKKLLTESLSMTCSSGQDKSDFYFHVESEFDKTTPLAKLYPFMTVTLSAPIEVINLLPFDFDYRIYDKDNRKDWSNTLKRGESSPVHVVQLSHLLLLSVHPKGAGYGPTDFAVINSTSGEFKRERRLVTRSEDGQKLIMMINYSTSKTGNEVVVYSPYLVLNKTGLDLQIKTRTNVATSKVSSVSSLSGREGAVKRAVPKMWSFENDDRANRALLRVGDSKWSGPQSFEALGSDYEVVVPSSDGQNEIHVGVSCDESQGKYHMTKVVTISPRFILCNKLKENIIFRDPNTQEVIPVESGQIEPVHFLRKSDSKQLTVSFAGSKQEWSAPFTVTNIGRTHVKLHKVTDTSSQYVLLMVDVILERATLYLHVSDAGKNWPYSIRNFTNMEFVFGQANPYVDEQGVELANYPTFKPINYRLPAKSVMPYAWDYPSAPMKEIMIECNGKKRKVQLAEIGNLPPMKVPNMTGRRGGIVDLNVVADGPTQTLVLQDYDPSTSMYKLKNTSQASAASSQADLFSVQEEEDSGNATKISVRLEGIGISLINRRLVELCYVTLRGFEFNYRSSELYETFSMKMKWLQVDNQLFGGIYPIVLFPSVVPKTGNDMESHPTFSASITRVRDDNHGVVFIKYATVLLQQMTCEIDEDFLFSLMDFARAFEQADEAGKIVLYDDTLDIPEPVRDTSGLDVYFEMLHIQPAQMDLSFVRTERVNVESRPPSHNAIMFFFNILTMAIGNINDAPVKLNALIMENVRTPLPLLAQSVQTHYSQEFLYQVHKILGSADFIGNPVGLFNNLSSGFMDMFYEPYHGYILNDSPQELGIGIAKGGLSFMKKSIFGVSDSISKVTGSISKGLSVATLDRNFQSKRRMNQNRNKPKHALYGFATGANSLFQGVTSGVSGLALSPYEGANKEGAQGFFKGIGKGIIGLPTKTAIGVFDFASSISEGVKNTTTVFDADAIDKVRYTRFIGKDGIVRPYSQREAVGQSWMKMANSGKYFKDQYLAHLNMSGGDKVVMVTYSRIMLLSVVKMTVEWEVEFQDLRTIAMERTGLALILRGGVQGPFIPISDVSSRRFLYKEIGIAVTDFNRKHQIMG